MLQDHFLRVKQELSEAIGQNTNPLRYAQLSTLYQGSPRSRTIVIRECNDELIVSIFTDARSNKLGYNNETTKACLLFYDPDKLLQVRLDGHLEVVQNSDEEQRLFQQVTSKSLKDYTTTLAPGTPIDHPDHVSYKSRDQNHFMALKFVTHALEFVQLKRPHHLRALYKKEADWKGQWLVP